MPETTTKTFEETALEFKEAYETVKPLEKALKAKIEGAITFYNRYRREHGYFESKYDWMSDTYAFSLDIHAGNIVEGVIYLEILNEDVSMSFEEFDNFESLLDSERVAYQKIKTARDEEVMRIKLSKIEEEAAEIRSNLGLN